MSGVGGAGGGGGWCSPTSGSGSMWMRLPAASTLPPPATVAPTEAPTTGPRAYRQELEVHVAVPPWEVLEGTLLGLLVERTHVGQLHLRVGGREGAASSSSRGWSVHGRSGRSPCPPQGRRTSVSSTCVCGREGGLKGRQQQQQRSGVGGAREGWKDPGGRGVPGVGLHLTQAVLAARREQQTAAPASALAQLSPTLNPKT